MSAVRERELNILRYVPSSSPAHRMWAGTKLVCFTALALATFTKPLWTTIGVDAAVVALFVLAARLPRGVVGHPPLWIWWGIGVSAVLAVFAGGKPTVHLLGVAVALGGLLDFLRITCIGLLFVALGMTLGWTTRLADIAGAVDALAAPARVVRLPADEVVLAIGLSVRCLPLVISDLTVLRGAWRVRAPVGPMSWRERVLEMRDLLVAAIVSSMRRAREMADAIDARGGPRSPYAGRRRHVHLGPVDGAAVLVVVAAIAAIALI